MTNYDADPADRDPGIALRASMGACVSDIRMPASLLERAVSRDRKRKARIRLTGAAGAAAAMAAAAVMIAAVPGRPSGRPGPTRPAAGLRAQDAAFVLSRAAAAMVDSDRMISVVRGLSGVTYTDVATQQQLSVSDDSSGKPSVVDATTISGGLYKDTLVDYPRHVYATFTTSRIDHGTPVSIWAGLPLQTNADPAVAFRQALKAVDITVAGHRSLNGRDTILLRLKPRWTSHRPPGVTPHTANLIWIDASTYLVVQTEYFGIAHFVPEPPHVSYSPIIWHVAWLAPIQRNLALLTPALAGFTKIPYTEMAKLLGS